MTWPGHTVVLGRTGSGKSHRIAHVVVPAWPGPVLYWAGGHEPAEAFDPLMVHVDGADPSSRVRDALAAGRKVLYTPSIRQRVADRELRFWQERLMSRYWHRPLLVVVDEAPRYAPQGSIDTPAHLLATGGRRWGVACVFVCQRVADLSKTVAAQCTTWVIHAHGPLDRAYLHERGVVLTPEDDAALERPYGYVTKHV